MLYFEEMDNKYGFNDGESIPFGIEKYRNVYCKVLNKLLAKNNSECRIVPFDRPGFHNWCLWLRISKNDYEKSYDELDGRNEIPSDEAWDKSVEEAYELGLDDYIKCIIEIEEDKLGELLNELP